MIRLIFTVILVLVANVACCQDYYFKPDSSVVLNKEMGNELLEPRTSRKAKKTSNHYYDIDTVTVSILETNFLKKYF